MKFGGGRIIRKLNRIKTLLVCFGGLTLVYVFLEPKHEKLQVKLSINPSKTPRPLPITPSTTPRHLSIVHSTTPRQTAKASYQLDLPSRLEERNNVVNELCQKIGKVTGKAHELSGIKSNNFTYCAIQKAGCTMWIRLTKFMAGQNLDTRNPMTLNKRMIHLQRPDLYKKFNREDETFIRQSVRTMTVRDPFTRLWSAYIDKFISVDFWETKGKQVIQMVRQNASQKSLRCGHDVTFSEFIQYVINTGHSFRHINQDKHWLPASDLCDPCTFKPHFIGKQETFLDDLTYTLQQIKLDHLIPNITSVNPTEFEIREEIDYTFWRYPHFSECISKCDLGKRLWTAFTYNGYVPPEAPFSEDTCEVTMESVESFYKHVDDVRKEYNVTEKMKKMNRKRFLSEAYSQLTADQIEKLQQLYKLDFDMFRYESNPDYLNRTNVP